MPTIKTRNPLSWNEIRARAIRFSREWVDKKSESAEAKTFWDEFFQVFGVSRKRFATFEESVNKKDGKKGFIDLLWKGVVLIEHKSRGKNLDQAYKQAVDYFPGLSDKDLPRYIVVCDFERFRVRDLENGEITEFTLEDLHQNIHVFGFIAGYETRAYREQDPVNIKAAEKLAQLHDQLLGIGYKGHDLEVYLVRILFCLFAEDTGIFVPRGIFEDFIVNRTSEDGSDLAPRLKQIFETLNTPVKDRLTNLDEQLALFPYVNGKLFEESLRMASFSTEMRQTLIECAELDWGKISPAIFGSLFQGIMDAEIRRNLGAHYTSEKNILKVITPLFLDDLRDELNSIRQPARLRAFHEKLASLTFLDPACGCGNFLVIAYRELRLLELEVIRRLHSTEQQQLSLDILNKYIKLDVDQFHGIEIEEWPAQIAQVAMWLMDHQMNVLVSKEFGQALVRIPLTKTAKIVHGNALQMNWDDLTPESSVDYIIGNPPFGGHHYQDDAQKADQQIVLREIRARGVLDFVLNWYFVAGFYIQRHPSSLAALVATNSITQGEQVGIFWPHLLSRGMKIHFAHRTFKWQNEAKGVAAVHCVIIGFGLGDRQKKILFDYDDIASDPHAISVKNINPYLVDAPDVVVTNRSTPLCNVPKMSWGNKPTDGGNLILSPTERNELVKKNPKAAKYVRRYMSGGDLLKGIERYCLWLVDASPTESRALPEVMKRIEAVRSFRLKSKAESTRDFAKFPTRFRQISQPDVDYLAVPEVSSEKREYLPIAYVSKDIICSNTLQFVPNADFFVLGVLTSLMHMAWLRSVAGRLKSDYRYSNSIVYNNFPWPEKVSTRQRKAIENAAKTILNERGKYPDASLADLYDPLTMPPDLLKAHQANDRAVDAAYTRRKFKTEAERVAFLFEQFQALTQL